MSFNFGGGGGQMPYIPPPPAPPAPNPPTLASADVQQAGLNKSQRPNLGFGSTMLTGGEGVKPQTAGKQLLGQ